MADVEYGSDLRMQVVERIIASQPFQKSARLRELLLFMAHRTIEGKTQDLTEHQIGIAVFGKPASYSVVEDSSVRVHVRQLRLKLHEYFDGEGRKETSSIEIPKGGYTVQFREIEPAAAPVAAAPTVGNLQRWLALSPWILAVLFLIAALAGWLRPGVQPRSADVPWPLSELFHTSNRPPQIVVADINFGMSRLIVGHPISLDQYLSPSYRGGSFLAETNPSTHEALLMKYLSGSLLTSYADLVVTTSLMRMVGASGNNFMIRSSRELSPRDLEEGNFVFVGSPSSNPWVSYFQDKLSFQEREGIVGKGPKYFENVHPLPGEQATYQGLSFTGNAGEDYATITLLPLPSGRGSVLILQGLQQEGTEAAGLFLADSENREKLRKAVNQGGPFHQSMYFEALIRTKAIAGSSNQTSIIATRSIRQ